MKPITQYVCAAVVILLFNYSAKADFVPVTNCGTTNGIGHAIFFVNADTGYVAGENAGKGVIQKTTDGGQTWANVYTSVKNLDWVVDIYFVNPTTGFAITQDSIVGHVLKTTDGGTTWIGQQLSSWPGKGIFFTSDSVGYIAGGVNGNLIHGTGQGVVYKTTDAGNNWTLQNTGAKSYLDDIYFTSADTGYTVGDYDILKTTNGGTSWVNVFPTDTINEHNIVFCTNAKICYVSKGGSIEKTTDGGTTWNTLAFPSLTPPYFYYFESIYFTSASIGYAAGAVYDTTTKAGNGIILKTLDAGQSWTDITNIPTDTTMLRDNELTSIQFVNSQLGYAVGGGGIILKTTNGGTIMGIAQIKSSTAISIYPNPASSKVNLNFDRPLAGVAVLYDVLGRVVKTIKVEGQQMQISVDELPSALYYVQVNTSEGPVYSGKILKTE